MEGELGEAHTHTQSALHLEPEHSRRDRKNLFESRAAPPSLLVDESGSKIAYKTKGDEIKEKKAEYIPTDKLRDLMPEEVVKERAKRRGKPIMKRKEQGEKKRELKEEYKEHPHRINFDINQKEQEIEDIKIDIKIKKEEGEYLVPRYSIPELKHRKKTLEKEINWLKELKKEKEKNK